MWNTSKEIMGDIERAHSRLLTGETNTSTAHAEARLFANALKVLQLELEHARMSGRLKDGSDVLPAFKRE